MDGTGMLFAPFIAALGDGLRVVVVRYPTHGALGYAECEAIARQALPKKGAFIILGESFSGPIAAALAASRPKGLVGLVLCATFVRNPYPLFNAFAGLTPLLPVKAAPLAAMRHFLLGRFATPALLTTLQAALAQLSATALQARVRAVMTVDAGAELQAVDVPILYLRATQDRVVPASATRQVVRLCPAVEVVDIDAPHFLLQAAPEPATRAVHAFVQRLEKAG
jgi:pimeloyl-ACP methyl ester carboxylesterase